MRRDPLLLGALLLAVASLVAAMSLGSTGPAPSLEPTGPHRPATRVVSLLPSLTEITAAVGAAECLVGRSSFCTEPAELCSRVPAVGGLLEPSLEKILALQPDLVLLPQGLGLLEDPLRVAGIASRYCTTDSLFGLEHTILEIGRVTDHEGEARALAALLRQRILSLRQAGQERGTSPRVLLVVGHRMDELEPLSVAGRTTLHGELLALAGADNVIRGVGWPTIGREALLRLNPEIIIDLMAPGTETPPHPERVLALWGELQALPAVRQGRVYCRQETAHVVPGPRLATSPVLRDLAAMLDGTASQVSME